MMIWHDGVYGGVTTAGVVVTDVLWQSGWSSIMVILGTGGDSDTEVDDNAID